MGDMLIRGIEPEMKRRLEESARRNRRSLSQEAVALMQKALTTQQSSAEKAGDRLYSLAGSATFSEEELEAVFKSRKEPDRIPPDLE